MQIKNLRWLSISVVVILLDQLTKFWAVSTLPFNQPVEILPVFNFYYAINQGAAFSFLSHKPELALWVFSSIAVVVSIGVIVWLTRISSDKK